MLLGYIRLAAISKKGLPTKVLNAPSFHPSKSYYNHSISLVNPICFNTLNFYRNPLSLTRGFHTTFLIEERIKSKVSYSSLLKHKKPDGLSGNERRRKLIKEEYKSKYLAKPINKNTRGFVPTRFKLEGIKSDVKKSKPNGFNTGLSYETLSARKKFRERESKRHDKPKFKEVGNLNPKEITKFDMVEMDTLENLEKKVLESNFNNMNIYPELLNCIPKIFSNIEEHNIRPTEIQALAIPELLKKDNGGKSQHVLCAAETGSGKTLAYLIPIISKLKESEIKLDFKSKDGGEFINNSIPIKNNVDFGTDDKDPFKNGSIPSVYRGSETNDRPLLNNQELRLLSTTNSRRLNRPRAIVLVPSCALAEQVHAVTKKLSHLVKFRSVLLTRSTVRKDFLRRLNNPIDVIVTTPASLMRYLDSKTLSLSEATQLVIDEADTMFEKGFEKEVKEIIKGFQYANKKINRKYQLQVVSATLPKLVLQTLDKLFPDLIRITTPSLHKSLPNCKQHFVDLKDYQGNRQLALLDTLRQFDQRTSSTNQQKNKDRILVFCNTRKSVSIVQTFLWDKKIECITLYGGDAFENTPPASKEDIQDFLYPSTKKNLANYDFNDSSRSVKLDSLDEEGSILDSTIPNKNETTAPIDSNSTPNSNPPKSTKTTPTKILICTDLASRGLDTTSVNHVILYDFPTSIVDFLHRCGRTARAGKFGIVTAFVGKKDRELADRIKRSVKTKTVLG